jgi:hypothetical protein
MGFLLTNRWMVTIGAAIGAIAVLMTYPGGPRAAYDDATDSPLVVAGKGPADAHLLERIAMKEGMVNELIAGRTSLADVSARFAKLNEDVPATLDVLRNKYPNMSEAQRTSCNVIDHVISIELPPPVAEKVLHRLQEEFCTLYGEKFQYTLQN